MGISVEETSSSHGCRLLSFHPILPCMQHTHTCTHTCMSHIISFLEVKGEKVNRCLRGDGNWNCFNQTNENKDSQKVMDLEG